MNGSLELLSEELNEVRVSRGAEPLWVTYGACVRRIGVTRVIALKAGDSAVFSRDLILHSNVSVAALARFEDRAAGASPLRRMALRASEPFLASKVMHTLTRSKATTWLGHFRQWLAEEELFVVPVRRDESLIGTVSLTGPAQIFDALTCSILTVVSHAAVFRYDELSAMPSGGGRKRLTERERMCLTLAASGMHTREIASQVRISERTARFHLDNARAKLGVATRALAIRKASRLGMLKK